MRVVVSKSWRNPALFCPGFLKHAQRLKAALGIAGVETTEAPWRYQSTEKSPIPGAQIDLLIDRRDNTINVCEMKFSESEFTIDI